jgi:2,3-bisphosphoglycerate-dependent phosphoglycerate mutase
MLAAESLTILLVRHAAPIPPGTPGVEDNDRPLASKGLQDAERLADWRGAVRIDKIYSSPYRRAFQTLEPLAKRRGLTIETVPDLRERHFMIPGTPDHEWKPQLERSWRDFDYAPPGGETGRIAGRIINVLEHLRSRHSSGTVIAGSHGNLIALALNAIDSRLSFEFWAAMPMPAVYELRWTEDGWRIVSGPNV